MARIIWSPSALKDIDIIAQYISKESLLAAQSIVQLFFERVEILQKHPGFGKPVAEVMNPRL
jgi:toxin ParE1/3/4